jgi:hypothetical protein
MIILTDYGKYHSHVNLNAVCVESGDPAAPSVSTLEAQLSNRQARSQLILNIILKMDGDMSLR